MRFARILFWEFVQNLPLGAGFIFALDFWQRGQHIQAIASVLLGSIVGSVLIYLTESKIVPGHREPWRVVAANVVSMFALTLILTAYLASCWSSWQSDVFFGTLAGFGVGASQDLAAGESIGARHCIALGFSASLALLVTRVLVANLAVWASILVLTTGMTLLVSLIDYGPSQARQ